MVEAPIFFGIKVRKMALMPLGSFPLEWYSGENNNK